MSDIAATLRPALGHDLDGVQIPAASRQRGWRL